MEYISIISAVVSLILTIVVVSALVSMKNNVKIMRVFLLKKMSDSEGLYLLNYRFKPELKVVTKEELEKMKADDSIQKYDIITS